MRAVCHLPQEVIGIRRQPADGVTMPVMDRTATGRRGLTGHVMSIPTLRRISYGVQILCGVGRSQR